MLHLPGAGAVWCQGPPVSSFSLLSPLLTPALVSRGRRQRRSLPLLLSPVLTQAKVTLFPPDGKMTATAATTSEKVREQPVGISVLFSHSLFLLYTPSSSMSLSLRYAHLLFLQLKIPAWYCCVNFMLTAPLVGEKVK